MPTRPPRLRCTGICKSFPGVRALDQVNLSVAPGSVHALVGENGAGKSTLMKILSGAQQADGGTIEIDGSPVDITDAKTAQQLGIAIVYQEFTLAPDLSISENIFLGRWPRKSGSPWINFASLHQQAQQLLESLGIQLDVRQEVATLSIAQQQMVEIAKALSLDARILILDEPSAVLTLHELETLFQLVDDLRQRDTSVIYISHRLDEVDRIADDVTVLRDGKHVSTRPIRDVTRNNMITEMVGRPLQDEFPARSCAISESVLQLEGLSALHRFENVSFDVRAGEVFGLTGLVGSGRSSIAKTTFGAVRATSGVVRLEQRQGFFDRPAKAIHAGLVMLPEDRKQEGLLLERSIRENITLADPKAISSWGVLNSRKEKALVHRLMTDLQIRAVSQDTQIMTLSGGNQQKVLLARWMSRPHRAMIFDEPTRGVDVGAKYEIYSLINRLASQGVAILMISSELPEVIGMADRIGVMHEGRLAGILDNGSRNVSQEEIMQLAAGEAQTK